jgi:hypothetical protein
VNASKVSTEVPAKLISKPRAQMMMTMTITRILLHNIKGEHLMEGEEEEQEQEKKSKASINSVEG